MIYLDNNATTRMLPRVAEAVSACLDLRLANPASSHRAGQDARRHLERSRETIAHCLGARFDRHPPDRVVLTSGATEANHLAIRGLAAARAGAVVVSSIEHPSVRGAAEQLAAAGRELKTIAAVADGRIDLADLERLLKQPTALVALMLVNNETGVIQPVAEAIERCEACGVPLHCDAVQAVGKLDVDFARLGAATMAVNAHKAHGPVGIGALLIRGGVELPPLMQGGGQQLGTRPGTESAALAAGMAAAFRHYLEHAGSHRTRLRRQRDELERRLAAHPRAVIIGAESERSPQTTNVAFPGLDRQELLMALDLHGVACSTGSACASGSSEPSPVLRAMGLAEEVIESSLRLSLGLDTTDEEIESAATKILEVVERMERK